MKQDIRTIIDISQDPGLHRNPVRSVVNLYKSVKDIPKYHWVPDKVDSRDYRYTVSKKSLSSSVDLRRYCSRIEDQGNLGSCTGQAIAGAIELLNNRNSKPTDVSRLFIYYYERALIKTINYDSGAYIRDGIKVTSHQGAPLESLWPYDITRFRYRPSVSAIKDAVNRRVTLYERVSNHQGCLDALNNGYPVVVGFYVYSSFETTQVSRTGVMPYPNTKREYFLGGHAVLLVGYDNVRQVYIARNSWGADWGDNGYFYMPYRVIQNTAMSGDFWIIKQVNNP